jgi:hypothetical protein
VVGASGRAVYEGHPWLRPLSRVALALLALPATCLVLCAFRVDPVQGWMMRHDCPLAMLTMNPPSHPMPLRRTAVSPALPVGGPWFRPVPR